MVEAYASKGNPLVLNKKKLRKMILYVLTKFVDLKRQELDQQKPKRVLKVP